jgi:uncharacterized OB-fold protein
MDPALMPYGLLLVDFPEGVRVLGMLHEAVDRSSLEVGMAVEVVTGTLDRVDDTRRVTWKFAPVGSLRGAAK